MSRPVKKIGALTLRAHKRGGAETGQWQVDVPPRFTLSGKRERLSYPTRQEAEEAAKKLLLDIRLRGSVGQRDVLPGVDAVELSLNALAEQWANDQAIRVAAGKKKLSSLETNLFQLKPVLATLGSLGLDRLTDRHLQEYQVKRREDGVRPPSINSELATLVQVQRWAKAKGLMTRIVTTDRIPYTPDEAPVLTPEEAQRLLDALPERVRVFVRFLLETGCRFGEAAQLKLRHVDLDQGRARITRRDDWTPKTVRSARDLILSAELCAAIRTLERTAECEFVFEGAVAGKPIEDIRRSFRTAVKAADIRRHGELVNFRPKDLRSNFATWIAMGGTRERVLQGMMGHVPGSKVTKAHYERATQHEHVAAAQALQALLRGGAAAA